jgi:hypothetical protein
VHFGDLVLADEAQRAELGRVGGLGEGEVVPGRHGAPVGVGDAHVEADLAPVESARVMGMAASSS